MITFVLHKGHFFIGRDAQHRNRLPERPCRLHPWRFFKTQAKHSHGWSDLVLVAALLGVGGWSKRHPVVPAIQDFCDSVTFIQKDQLTSFRCAANIQYNAV